jgi:beta-glucanase (GH16 family)
MTPATPILSSEASTQEVPAKTLRFSGYDWEVREQKVGGPGPNQWDSKNVWVDKNGSLHLKISRVQGTSGIEWHCAELTSKKKFGFGKYEFQTSSRIDQLDRNVVLGLFNYPAAGQGADGTNEIDIEFARWGKSEWPNGNFTVYPATGARSKDDSHSFEYALPHGARDLTATHRFTRATNQVTLATFAGIARAGDKSLAQWTYAPLDQRLIPQQALAMHLNLWLFQGKAPSNDKEVEVVVKKFSFTPME